MTQLHSCKKKIKEKIICVWMISLRDQMILYRYRQKIIMLFLLPILTEYYQSNNMQQQMCYFIFFCMKRKIDWIYYSLYTLWVTTRSECQLGIKFMPHLNMDIQYIPYQFFSLLPLATLPIILKGGRS